MRRNTWIVLTAVILTAVFSCQGTDTEAPQSAPEANGTDPATSRAHGLIVPTVPESPSPAGRYVLYLHGRIVQEQGPRPSHPRFGTYEYQRVVEALAAPGSTVISAVRSPGTQVGPAAAEVVLQIDALLEAGVPADRITVVGFSMGGAIAAHVSSLMARDDLRFVLLATCGPWMSSAPELELHGNILAITESSDDLAGPCKPWLEDHDHARLKEIGISTGGGHGAFYRPGPEWIEPTLAWIAGEVPD